MQSSNKTSNKKVTIISLIVVFTLLTKLLLKLTFVPLMIEYKSFTNQIEDGCLYFNGFSKVKGGTFLYRINDSNTSSLDGFKSFNTPFEKENKLKELNIDESDLNKCYAIKVIKIDYIFYESFYIYDIVK